MKKLLMIIMLLVGISYISEAQTDYSPTILSKKIEYAPGDTLLRVLVMNQKGWDNKQLKFNLVRMEYATLADTVPWYRDSYIHHNLMDSIFTHYHEGQWYTNTGRWFVEQIYESGPIKWDLFISLAKSIYFNYWDKGEKFFRNEE